MIVDIMRMIVKRKLIRKSVNKSVPRREFLVEV